MKIKVASMICPTFHSEISSDRNQDESITDYLKKEMHKRIKMVEIFIREAFGSYSRNEETLFFTLPEFFWNIKWSAIKNKAELNELAVYMQNNLSEELESLMTQFYKNGYSEIVLLAGTVAVLIEKNYNDKRNDLTYYESLNYCLVFNNIKKHKSMWPKRMTSPIDFGKRTGRYTIRTDKSKNILLHKFKLSECLTVDVLTETEWAAEHYDSNGSHNYKLGFYNDVVEGCPFSINLCLDYIKAPTDRRHYEAGDMRPKIDFLLSCGMQLSREHKYPRSVQYAIRNDGGSRYGVAECFAVESGSIKYDKQINGENIYSIDTSSGVKVSMDTYFLDIKDR